MTVAEVTGADESIDVGEDGLRRLADRYGTPFYVYDLDAISARADSLRRALPPSVELAFAVKANPLPAILHHLAQLGLGADVASAGELDAACQAGIDPRAIVFTGPGKRDEELLAAARAGLRAVTVESPGELQRLRVVARRTGSRVPVMLRAAGSPAQDAGRPIVGYGAGKFGMRRTDLARAARLAGRAPEVELVGVHAFHASNVLDAEVLLDHAARTLALAAELAGEAGVRFRLVDVGGGLGIPYADGDRELDIGRLGTGLAELHERWRRDPAFDGLRLLLEPGRYLVGPPGVYVARVIDVKRAEDGVVAIVDGGIHHLSRPALIGQPHRLRLMAADGRPRRRVPVTIGGPLCTGLDVLCHRLPLPWPRPGDLVAIEDTGAYGFTESMLLFLSHPSPAEVVVRAGRSFLARPRFMSQLPAAGGRCSPPSA